MRNSNLRSSSTNQSDASFISPENYDHEDMQEEESGWTFYFDDYFSNKSAHPSASKHEDYVTYDNDKDKYHGCHGGSGSVVSDAASCAAWKYTNIDGRITTRAKALAACSSFDGTQMVIHKKLRLKEPINRHKRSGENYYDDSLEDTASSPVSSPKAKGDQYRYDQQQDQENGLKTSLKEKGLCLVPYSTLINYIG